MKYRFLLYISYSYSIPIGNPIETEIKRRGYEVKWFSDEPDGSHALEGKENALHSIKEVLDFNPHILLVSTDNVPDFIPGLKVQIFHGFLTFKRPEKGHSEAHFRVRGFFDLYCTQGPNTTEPFKALAKRNGYFDVIETGWSKVDPLFVVNQTKSLSSKVILIASTFTRRLSLAYNEDIFDEIKRLSASGKYNFKMVLHPKLPAEIKNKWQSLNGSHFKFYDTTDLVPLFLKSDLLLADTTSAIQEFLLLINPVVAFRHTIKHKYLCHVDQVSELEYNIDQALEFSSELKAHIQNFVADLHPYIDGKSSERVIDASIDFLHKDKSYLRSKPINLWRKYLLRKKLNYFTLKSFNSALTIPKDHQTTSHTSIHSND
jgi:CDP-glycerol glycerophosphotransferase (TagB/SpsB family)